MRNKMNQLFQGLVAIIIVGSVGFFLATGDPIFLIPLVCMMLAFIIRRL